MLTITEFINELWDIALEYIAGFSVSEYFILLCLGVIVLLLISLALTRFNALKSLIAYLKLLGEVQLDGVITEEEQLLLDLAVNAFKVDVSDLVAKMDEAGFIKKINFVGGLILDIILLYIKSLVEKKE